jgi:hypothetical protein
MRSLLAARMGYREVKAAGAVILEPIMKMEYYKKKTWEIS